MDLTLEKISSYIGDKTAVMFETRFGNEDMLERFKALRNGVTVEAVTWANCDKRATASGAAYVAILSNATPTSSLDRDETVITARMLETDIFCLVHAEHNVGPIAYQPQPSMPLPQVHEMWTMPDLPTPLFLLLGRGKPWVAVHLNRLIAALDEAAANGARTKSPQKFTVPIVTAFPRT